MIQAASPISSQSIVDTATPAPNIAASDTASVWRRLFHRWPQGLPPTGVVVTTEEQIPFEGFMISEDIVLLERRSPDVVGGRKVLVPLAHIAALKIVDVVKGKLFEAAGFKGNVDRKH